jgi:Domain of unknown function (DUF1906)
MNTRSTAIAVLALTILFAAPACHAQDKPTYVGFDENLYPGDAMLPTLHKNLAYVGYWLNNPPGEKTNQWKGKRNVLVQNGFGFLILFNGHLDAEFRHLDPVATGRSDAAKAIAAATAEGFPAHAVIFLDVEEGGRMLPRTNKYVAAWVDALRHSNYRPGAYCAGIETEDDPGTKISTADDVHNQFPDVPLWLANDQCPPAPGCVIAPPTVSISLSGRPDALVWQYSQSPRRPELTRRCAATYAKDGNCYAPGTPKSDKYGLDLNLSTSPDPSNGR